MRNLIILFLLSLSLTGFAQTTKSMKATVETVYSIERKGYVFEFGDKCSILLNGDYIIKDVKYTVNVVERLSFKVATFILSNGYAVMVYSKGNYEFCVIFYHEHEEIVLGELPN